MLEVSDSEIKVDRLMHEIREAAARGAQGANVPAAGFPPTGEAWPGALAEFSPLSLQPEFQPRGDNQYHVGDLLKYHGGDFVRNAYRAILRREPDPAGFAQHLESLAGGRFNKVDVLASLRNSPEGERAGVKVAGLAWPAAIRRAGRAPVVGYLIQLIIALGRLPLLVQNQRQSEFYLLSQQQRIADHHNQAHEQLAQNLAQVAAQTAAGASMAAAQQRLMESWSRRQQDEAARRDEFRDAVEKRLDADRERADSSARQVNRRVDALRRRLEDNEAALTRRVEEGAAELARRVEEQVGRLLESHGQLAGLVEEQARQFLERYRKTRDELAAQERRLTLLL
ncbi:MAG TPA: DUF4214 domain-containing protein, partial [Pyrinomonadaceae bacterium]|nr:DUF4214 domain-containing protein [Pyrinomonadaceae bacterium]